MKLQQVRENFNYYCNDGVITHADLKAQIFETRNFQTGRWQKTEDQKLILKMIQGKGALPSQEAADRLFEAFRKKMYA